MRIAVLGGGVAGLAMASLCLRLDEEVNLTLFEANTWLGGKLRRIHLGDQVADLGPSIFTLPQIWNKFRGTASEFCPQRMMKDLDLVRMDGLGSFVNSRMNFALPPPPGGPLQRDWTRYMKKHSQNEKLILDLMTMDPSDWRASLLALRLLKRYGGHLNVEAVLRSEKFSQEVLTEALSIHSLNSGVSPRSAFAIFASIPALMAQSGVYIPKGGMSELVNLLESDLKSFGHRFHLRLAEPVLEVNPDLGQIKTAGAPTQTFDLVVNALDEERWARLSGKNLPESSPQRYSCSAMGIFATLKDQAPPLHLTHSHTVLMPENLAQFSEQISTGLPLESSMCFLNYYPAHGPIYQKNSKSLLAFLITVPPDGLSYDLDTPLVKRELRRAEKLFKWQLPLQAFAEQIEIFDPKYFESFGAKGGSIYGKILPISSMGPFQVVKHRDPKFKRVYHVGASVYPGGGLPAIFSGVQIAARLMEKSIHGR